MEKQSFEKRYGIYKRKKPYEKAKFMGDRLFDTGKIQGKNESELLKALNNYLKEEWTLDDTDESNVVVAYRKKCLRGCIEAIASHCVKQYCKGQAILDINEFVYKQYVDHNKENALQDRQYREAYLKNAIELILRYLIAKSIQIWSNKENQFIGLGLRNYDANSFNNLTKTEIDFALSFIFHYLIIDFLHYFGMLDDVDLLDTLDMVKYKGESAYVQYKDLKYASK